MPLTKEKRKLNKLIQESDSEDSEHELSYYVNDRIKLMKEVLKTVKAKKIKLMAPSCLRNTDVEEINSMLLEELLGISNKRLKYIFNGQSLDEDSSSSTSEDKPEDVISLDDISDDDLVITIDDDEGTLKGGRRGSKHHKCKKEKNKNVVKQEKKDNSKLGGEEEKIGSNKNLMSVLELLELQARARAIKSQLLLENAKTQEAISSNKVSTIEEIVGSDDEVIIKTAKTEEIVITSSESENEDVGKDEIRNENKANTENTDTNLEKVAESIIEEKSAIEETEVEKIKIIDNTELSNGKFIGIKEGNEIASDEGKKNLEIDAQNIDNTSKEMNDENKEKSAYNDGIIQINLSDDEMEELK